MSLMTAATALNESAHKYRKQLLGMPATGIGELLPYMTGFPGVTYKQTVGEILTNTQLRPYDGNNNAIDTTLLSERTLETFLGSVVELFDPNALRQTIYAQTKANGDTVKDSEFALAQLQSMMNSVLSYLAPAAWSGVRNASGSTTAALFNGLDTITATEVTATNLSVAAGNYELLTSAITASNAFDALRAIWKNASPELRMKECYMFVPHEIAWFYQEDFLSVVGAAGYNQKFNQMDLVWAPNWKMVPLVGKTGSNYIHVTTKNNMLYGYGDGVEGENIEIRRGDNAFKLQFILSMFFGVQFATLNKKEIYVAELASASS